MSRADDQLTQLRAARDEARARLTRRIEQTRELATPAGLTRRLQRDLTAKARSAMVQAIEIAGDNRGIVAATASAVRSSDSGWWGGSSTRGTQMQRLAPKLAVERKHPVRGAGQAGRRRALHSARPMPMTMRTPATR